MILSQLNARLRKNNFSKRMRRCKNSQISGGIMSSTLKDLRKPTRSAFMLRTKKENISLLRETKSSLLLENAMTN